MPCRQPINATRSHAPTTLAKVSRRVRKGIRLREVPRPSVWLGERNVLHRSVPWLRSPQAQRVTVSSASSANGKPQIHPHRLGVGVAPVPPSRRGLPSSGRPAARASRFTRSRASCTRSEKVVSATSWRGVKSSPNAFNAVVSTPERLLAQLPRACRFRLPRRLRLSRDGFHLRRRRQDTPVRARPQRR